MAIIVEDGTGLASANSYCSEDTLGTYCDDRGLALASGDAEAALVRATNFIDSKYRARFPGFRTKRRAQALEWPRASAFVYHPDLSQGAAFANNVGDFGYGDLGYDYLPSDQVPIEIVRATCEAAIRELDEPGSMMPDLERGGQITAIRAGSVGVDYSASAPVLTVFSIIDGILGSLLGPVNRYSAKAVRG